MQVLSDATERTFALVFDVGEDPMEGLTAFSQQHRLDASHFTAIGALSEVTLGYFDWELKDYLRIEVREQVEVLALLGDIALDGEQPKVHAHIVVGRRDGSTRGGHLLSARVRPTLEVVLTESPGHLRRVYDPELRLALIRPGA